MPCPNSPQQTKPSIASTDKVLENSTSNLKHFLFVCWLSIFFVKLHNIPPVDISLANQILNTPPYMDVRNWQTYPPTSLLKSLPGIQNAQHCISFCLNAMQPQVGHTYKDVRPTPGAPERTLTIPAGSTTTLQTVNAFEEGCFYSHSDTRGEIHRNWLAQKRSPRPTVQTSGPAHAVQERGWQADFPPKVGALLHTTPYPLPLT